MKRKLIFLLNIALLLVTSGVLAQSGTNYDVHWSVMGNAGEQFVSGGSYQLGFTLAQDTPPLVSAGGSYQIVQGYWTVPAPCYDLSGDGQVAIDDVMSVASRWRTSCAKPDPDNDPGTPNFEPLYDIDDDCDIDIVDIMLVVVQWGKTC
jgi:hypothetical protein